LAHTYLKNNQIAEAEVGMLGWLRVRMVKKRHQNLKEMLLGDLQAKVMQGIEIQPTTKSQKKCRCHKSHHVNGRCLYKGECETPSVIYKLTCKCCGDYYLGKTQNTLKKRVQCHYQGVGQFWDLKRTVNRGNGLELESIRASSSPSTKSHMTTRSGSRHSQSRGATTIIHTPLSNRTEGYNHLLSLLSPALSLLSNNNNNNNTAFPTTIMEEDESVMSNASALSNSDDDSFVTATQEAPPSIASSNQPSLTSFQRAFGGRDALIQLRELEKARTELLRPILESKFNSLDVSNFTKHMWSHAEEQDFQSKTALYAWVRENMEVDLVHKSNMISTMKTAGTKSCKLCMQERINLFFEFGKKKTLTHNMMNSRTELYGSCSCKTRFLRLRAVGNAGAEEATS